MLLLALINVWDFLDSFTLVTVALLFAFFLGRPLSRFVRRLEGYANRLGRRPVLSLVVIFLLAIAFRIALLPVMPVSAPQAHDEFSYLLAADTFAHGRLTNPTPAMWKHIESFHMIFTPSYQSQYPPGQGLLLALGQLLGHPFIGVVLGTALMCAVMTWALRAWVSPKWAFISGFLLVLKYAGAHYWTSSYWGGSLAALGAALVFGAAKRLTARPTPRDAAFFALGAMVLANTRPYEGLVFVVMIGAWVLWRAFRAPVPLVQFAKVVAAPALVVILSVASWMAYYNFRVTGSATTMPYEVNIKQYKYARPFLWQHPVEPPHYRYVEMKRYFDWELYGWNAVQTKAGLFQLILGRTNAYYERYIYPMFVPFLLAIVLLWRGRKHRILLLTSLAMWVAILVESWGPNEHYLAPGLPVLFLVTLFGIRELRFWKLDSGIGLRWSRILVFFFAFQLIGENVQMIVGKHESPVKFPEQRLQIAHELERIPGNHLVLVEYEPKHDFHQEWVFNSADPDSSRIVWAREMDAEENRKLIEYYHDRKVWVLRADEARPEVQALNTAEAMPTSAEVRR